MKYYYGTNIPNELRPTIEVEAVRTFKNDEMKSYILNEEWAIDEIINPYSHHTLLHESITAHNEELFNFLLIQKANAMARDHNGYTPLLKAASIGYLDMVKSLIEDAGVDPRHTDRHGNTPLDKAKLYEHKEVIEYLEKVTNKIEQQEKDIENGVEIPEDERINLVDWSEQPLFHRGRYRTIIDYRSQ